MHFDPIDVGSWRDRLKLSKCHRQSTSEYNFPTFLVTSGRHSYDLSNNFSWNTLVVFQLTAKLITTIKIPIIKGNWKCWIRWWGNWCHWWQMMMCTHMKTICRGRGGFHLNWADSVSGKKCDWFTWHSVVSKPAAYSSTRQTFLRTLFTTFTFYTASLCFQLQIKRFFLSKISAWLIFVGNWPVQPYGPTQYPPWPRHTFLRARKQ